MTLRCFGCFGSKSGKTAPKEPKGKTGGAQKPYASPHQTPTRGGAQKPGASQPQTAEELTRGGTQKPDASPHKTAEDSTNLKSKCWNLCPCFKKTQFDKHVEKYVEAEAANNDEKAKKLLDEKAKKANNDEGWDPESSGSSM